MKHSAIGLAILAGLLSGCELLMPKEESPQGGNAQAGGGDPTEHVRAPAELTGVQTDQLQVGWEATQVSTSPGGQKSTTSYAVVGETGDSWQIEHVHAGLSAMAKQFPELEGQLIGLTVNKSDGEVTKAVLGEPGGEVKEIELAQAGGGAPGPQGEGMAEDVTIGLGTFPAMRYETGGTISWVGTQGEMEGVLLKVEGEEPHELDAMPEPGAVTVSERELGVTKLSYSNGKALWVTADDVVAAFFGGSSGKGSGLYKKETEAMTQVVTDVGTAAEPQLSW